MLLYDPDEVKGLTSQLRKKDKVTRLVDLRGSWHVSCSMKEKERDLFQYRIFENDSDGDVAEGLGNTTLNIAPMGDLSSEDEVITTTQGKDNKTRDVGDESPTQTDKNIQEIPLPRRSNSAYVAVAYYRRVEELRNHHREAKAVI